MASPTDQPPLTGKDLEDPSNVKPPALGEREELAKEQEEGQDAEDDGEDHHRLDRLQPFCGKTDRKLSRGIDDGIMPCATVLPPHGAFGSHLCFCMVLGTWTHPAVCQWVFSSSMSLGLLENMCMDQDAGKKEPQSLTKRRSTQNKSAFRLC